MTLPNAFAIDQRHLGNICSRKSWPRHSAPAGPRSAKRRRRLPLLDKPLSGPVYAVSGSGGLPRLAFILNGQVNLVPEGRTTTVNGQLKTTVPVVPDAPIGHFRLTLSAARLAT